MKCRWRRIQRRLGQRRKQSADFVAASKRAVRRRAARLPAFLGPPALTKPGNPGRKRQRAKPYSRAQPAYVRRDGRRPPVRRRGALGEGADLETIAIGTAAAVTEVRERLSAAFRPLRDAGVRVEIEEQNRGPWTFLGCSFDTAGARGDADALSRQTVADALSEFITDRWQDRLLGKLLSNRYSYFNPDEQASISAAAARRLARDGHARPVRRSRILARLQEYLEKHNTVVVDGFVTFRCKDYMEELESALDQAVDEFLLEREYQEFVRLLRYFVDSQPPRHDVVHALVLADGSFQLTDAGGRPLNNDALADLATELAARDVALEDLLISALISLAPRTVVLHRHGMGPTAETLATVEAVFGRRLSICPGCPRCPPG